VVRRGDAAERRQHAAAGANLQGSCSAAPQWVPDVCSHAGETAIKGKGAAK
jgi:hypothetical protein